MASPPPGGGGGKIRTRRYHINAKPYSKSQQQQGIIGRVTDSVKSIVPVWLQRYFNKSDDTSTNVSGTRSPRERPETNQENDHHAYVHEEPPQLSDGRVNPEAVSRHVDEPSTSRTTLNFTDVLTRPSLHRSNLNFNMLDSPALHCQPSTSSAFPIGSSTFSFVKEIKETASQHDDDNISTTSGFSSRASDKDVSVSKNTSAPPLWSPEPDRSHSFSHHSSTSLKKPAFNLSAFGSLSPSLANTSVVKSSQLGDSPFYPGKTAYGGAASTRPSKVRTTPYQAPLRRQMKAKQSSVQSYGVTSSTARRILQSLDKMSSPLADAKRIPSAASSPLSLTPERSYLDVTEFHSRKKIDSHYPPVQKLMTPKSLSVSSNRSMYIKPSLPASQASKINRRTVDDRGSRKRGLSEAMQENPDQSFSYPKSSTPAANGLSSGGGKMRRERGAHYTKSIQDEEDVDVPALPNIALPISTAALPSFSFGTFSKTTSSPSTVVAKPALKMVPPTSSLNNSPVFTFSSPIMKSKETEAPPSGSPIGFTFSIPSVKSADLPIALQKSVSRITSPAKDVILNSTSGKKDEEKFEGLFKPAKTLKEGSVLDILKSPGFGSPKTSTTSSSLPLTNTLTLTRPGISTFSTGGMTFGETSKRDTLWQCDACLVQNKATENKCKACSAAKASTLDAAKQTVTLNASSSTKTAPATMATKGFGDKFKTAAGAWDCDTCLVQNKPETTKCVACETPKPGTVVKPALTLPAHNKDLAAVTAAPSSFPPPTNLLGFGDKFKRPPGSWDCTVCLVQNKAEDSKCVSCLSQKPGDPAPVTSNPAISVSASFGGTMGFGEKFKKLEGTWDCETCLVQNKPDNNKCAACESAKPGTKAEFKGFGTSAPSSAATPSFKFGIETSEASKTSGSISGFKFGDQGGFKFGATTSDSGSSSTATVGFSFPKGGEFSFGIQSTNSKTEPKKDSTPGSTGFTFGLASGTSNPPAAPLQFGTPSPAQQEKKEHKTTSGSLIFGTVSSAPAAPSESTGGFSFKKAEEKPEATASPFSFGKPSEKINETPAALGGFTFGKLDPPKEPASVSALVMGRTDDKSDPTAASGPPLMFGVQTEKEPAKPAFSFGKSDQTKDDPAQSPFSFSLAKPAEAKETEQSAKQSLTFGVSTSTPDQGAAKPSFGFLAGSSSSTAVSSTLATSSSAFGSTTSASNPPAANFVFGQASSTSGSSAFGSANEVKAPQSFMFSSQESKPATTSSSTGTTAAATPFVFGPVANSNVTSTPNFSFGAVNTSSSTGTTNTPFLFGSGSSAAVAPSFGTSKTPAFGQGSTQTNTPAFAPVFSAGSHPAIAFGSGGANSQTPVFGQQGGQPPAFGTATTTSNAGPNFQFGGNTGFNFSSSTPSGIFTFGSNSAAPTAPPPQPSSTGSFGFNQPAPSFTLGTNGKNTSNRRIKTAVRRRK